MVRADITSGAAFKAALRGTLLLFVVLTASGLGAYNYLKAEMINNLRDQIHEDETALTDIYSLDGKDGLVEAIDGLRHPLPTKIRLLGLFDAEGNPLAGNLSIHDEREGWFETTVPSQATPTVATGRQPSSRFLVKGTRLGDLTLLVGLNMTAVEAKEREMILAFTAVGVVVGAAFLVIGYAGSLTSMRKLQHMAAVLDRVSQGESGTRLDVSFDNDQIDRVARAMNLHLDRLTTLMATTKASAAAIAHDLRTPLSRAFLAVDKAQMLLDRGDDPVEALEEIESELSRLRAIFDVILRISRLDQAQEAPPLAPLDVAPLLADLAETFAILAEDRGQTLIFDPVPHGLTVQSDGPMLSQMLANLIQNAINHCHEGTLIRLAAEDAGPVVRLIVADSGPGIPESERGKVFDLFYSVDPNRSRGGNGLGLALVRAIAERLGARISLNDNNPGLRVEIDVPKPPVA
jgi:signal transduction histidine kinase